jgi:tetratricopeptide (TPR) repeat protein
MPSVSYLRHRDARGGGLVAAALAGAVLVVFYPALDAGWVNFDDGDYVTENSGVTGGPSAAGVRWAFTTFHQANWHPLTWLSLQFDASLWGTQARGYHLTNVLLHAANAALLFLALRALTGAFWRSATVALLFAVHPLRAESVAWVSERKDVLGAFFGLLALWAYAAYSGRPACSRYVAVAAALAASLLCKPMLVTLPFLLLVLDWWPLGRAGAGGGLMAEGRPATPACAGMGKPVQGAVPTGSRRGKAAHGDTRPKPVPAGAVPAAGADECGRPGRIVRNVLGVWRRLAVEKLPLLALATASAVVTLVAQAQGDAVGDLEEFPFGVRVANAAVSYVQYLSQSFWPARLSAFYPHPGDQLPLWKAAGAAVLLAAVTAAALALRRRAPYVLAGWLWFVGTLVPVIGLVQVGKQGMADRYTYLPQIGLLVTLCWGVADLAAGRVRVAAVAAAVAAVPLALLTRAQVAVWHDSVALWEHSLRSCGATTTQLINLGSALEDQGFLDDAAELYRRVLGRDPGAALAHSNLGNVLYRQGRYDEAVREQEQAAALAPRLRGAWYNLGLAESTRGNLARAAACYREALRLKPDFAEAHSGLGNVLLRTGHAAEGFDHLREAVRLRPDYAEGHVNLGKGLAERGDFEAAARQFEVAARPGGGAGLAAAWYNLGAVRVHQRRLDDAVDCLVRAADLEPESAAYRDALDKVAGLVKAAGRPDLLGRIEQRPRRPAAGRAAAKPAGTAAPPSPEAPQ